MKLLLALGIIIPVMAMVFLWPNEEAERAEDTEVKRSERRVGERTREEVVEAAIVKSRKEVGRGDLREKIEELIAQWQSEPEPEFEWEVVLRPSLDAELLERKKTAKDRLRERLDQLAFHWGVLKGPSVMAEIRRAELNGVEREISFVKLKVWEGWLSVDPDAALNSYGSDFERGMNSDLSLALRGHIPKVFDFDPDAVDRYLVHLFKKDRSYEISHYLDDVSKLRLGQGIEAAEKWARNFPEEKMRPAAISSLLKCYASENPVAASKWTTEVASQFQEALPAGEVTEGLLSSGEDRIEVLTWANGLPIQERSLAIAKVVERFAEEDAFAAAEFMKKQWSPQLTEESRTDAHSSVVEGLVREDIETAVEYLEKIPKGLERDSVTNSFALEVATSQKNPSVAMEWVETIENEGLRNDTELLLSDIWARDDPEGAEKWLVGSSIGDAKKEGIQRWIDSAKRTRDQPSRRFSSEVKRN